MDVENGRSAVIVGGGIGGLASAVALHRTGWAVTVCERARGEEAGGAGLTVWPNAVRALQVVGLDAALRARAAVLRGMGVRRPDGHWLSRVGGDQIARRYGEPPLAVVRSELVELLASALPPGVLRLGGAVSDVDAGGPTRPASARCDDRLITADLVVGADGVGSRVRRELWPAQPAARYSGYVAWRALVRAPAVTVGSASETWGRGRRFGVVPVGEDLIYVYATVNAAAGEQGADHLAELRRRFGDWHDPIPDLLAALEPGSVLRHDVMTVHPSLRRLHRGRVALIGDAAHAMEPNLGQGACLAIEDAVVLAHCLADGLSVPAALAVYNRARAARVADLARQSARLGRLTQSRSAVVTLARDAATRLVPQRLALRGFDAAAGWLPPTMRPSVPREEPR